MKAIRVRLNGSLTPTGMYILTAEAIVSLPVMSPKLNRDREIDRILSILGKEAKA